MVVLQGQLLPLPGMEGAGWAPKPSTPSLTV